MRLSMRYYDIDEISASCGNTRYYVLPSKPAIDGMIGRSIDRQRGDVSITTSRQWGVLVCTICIAMGF